MNEETQQFSKEKSDSAVMGVSVRAWLATMLTVTVCLMALWSIKVEEPLYTMATIALGFYFGQKAK